MIGRWEGRYEIGKDEKRRKIGRKEDRKDRWMESIK